ncbi:MAG: hypothetical protein U0556_13295 [Dehalococcoidia bacterium]
MREHEYSFHAEYRRQELAREAAQARLLKALKDEQTGDKDVARKVPFLRQLVTRALAR